VCRTKRKQSLVGFEYTLGRGPRFRSAEGMSFSKDQFVEIFNGSPHPIPSIRDPAILTPCLGPTVASVSNVPAVMPPLHQSGQECKQQ
jgi:hypothetical protein